MRIVFLSDDFPPQSFGGAGIIAYNVAHALVRLGHQVLIITTVDRKKDVGRTEYNGITVERLYSAYPSHFRAWLSLYNPQVVKRVKALFEEFKPDIVHAHNIHQHLSYHSLAVASHYTDAVFLTAHDGMLVHYGKVGKVAKISMWQQFKEYRWQYNPFRNLIIRQYLKYVKVVFAVSEALGSFLKYNGIRNVTVMTNGIDVSSWQVDQEIINEGKVRYDLVGKQVLLMAGRLSNAKGGEMALRILNELRDKYPNLVLLIAGDKQGLSRNFDTQIENLALGEQIIYTGWISRSDMPLIYGLADVALTLSGYVDPFPTVNLEAMAAGKPVVGTIHGGTPEVVQDGITGFIVDPSNLSACTDKISRLLNDPLLRVRMGQAGYERVKKDFSLAEQVEILLAWYGKK